MTRIETSLEPAASAWPAPVGTSQLDRMDLASQSHETAFDDVAALKHWLAIYALRRATTFRSYRAEAFKFRYFLEVIHPERAGTPAWAFLLRDATERDAALYETALQGIPHNEIPPVLFSGAARKAFSRPLKRSSINRALAILHAMYEHFRAPSAATSAPYVNANPTARLLASSNRAQGQTARIVPEAAIKAMGVTVQNAIAHHGELGDQAELARAMRLHWIFVLLFGLWGRRAEICGLRMNDFQQTHDGWEVRVQRKGGRQEHLPVSEFVLAGLQTYRISLGMPALPSSADILPAVLPLQHKGRRERAQNLSEETLYQEVRRLAVETAERIRAGHSLPEATEDSRAYILDQLSQFSPHWFRHTGASLAINGGFMSLDSASKMLGHTSPAVTASMYHHGDRDSMRSGIDGLAGAIAT